ncbi:MAG: HPr family phosphocarrier protein [Pseudomonadales bacterium]
MIVEKATIINKLGLHARAASKFVSTAQAYSANITVRVGDRSANGKSIMAMMVLQGVPGTELEIYCEGDDEEDACQAIVSLINDRFGEEE